MGRRLADDQPQAISTLHEAGVAQIRIRGASAEPFGEHLEDRVIIQTPGFELDAGGLGRGIAATFQRCTKG